MQKRQLGNSGLWVTPLALGTMTWGRATDEHEARDQLTSYVNAGGNIVDTAAGYSDGEAEHLLGSMLGKAISRNDLVIATKAGFARQGNQRIANASRGYLLRTLDESLRRLGVDHIDLWQVHTWVDDAPLEETLHALDIAVTSGRAAYVGISNYNGWQTAQAATWQAAIPHRVPLVSTQMEYSLVNRSVEAEVLPAAQALGLGLLAWSPLGRGVLTGKYRHGTPADSRGASSGYSSFVGRYSDERSRGVVEALCRAAEGLEVAPLQAGLAWVRDRPGVTSAIMGARTHAQLEEALASATLELPAEIIQALNDVS